MIHWRRFAGLLVILPLITGLGSREHDPNQLRNWTAPAFWSAQTVTPPGEARQEAVSAATAPLPFVAVSPCRGADTRGFGFTGQYGTPSLSGDSTRSFTITGICGIPASAVAVSFNFTVTDNPTYGDIRVYPAGEGALVSTLNWGPSSGNVANAAVVRLGSAGQITVQVDGPGPLDLIFDINGYYDGNAFTQLAGGRRAALRQFWTPQTAAAVGVTALASALRFVESDGADLWVTSATDTVSRVRGSDGKLLDTWTGVTGSFDVVIAMGRILVNGSGKLYAIDPRLPGGAATVVAGLGTGFPSGIAFDGSRVWSANATGGTGGSVSIVTPGSTIPWASTTVATGFSSPVGVLYDGTNVWVTDSTAGTLLKLDASGGILQTVPVGSFPEHSVFDGTNIWVPNTNSNSVTVVRSSTGTVVTTLTGNGLNKPGATAFDGQRVLVTNLAGSSVSLWKAADLTPLGSFPVGSGQQIGACSDGINFWIALFDGKLVRF